jgi:hypothetical protein
MDSSLVKSASSTTKSHPLLLRIPEHLLRTAKLTRSPVSTLLDILAILPPEAKLVYFHLTVP